MYNSSVTRGAGFGLALALASCSYGQFIGTNFSGTDGGNNFTFSPWDPPDTMGAIGPAHFVEFINGAFAVYNKAGAIVGTKTDENPFWVTAFNNAGAPYNPGEPNLTDPRVFYDQLSRRWFAVEVDFSNNVLLARTDTNDPSGTWKAVRFSAGTTSSNFPDYPTLGMDANGVYVGADMGGSSGTISLWSIPKADLLASSPTVANRSSFLRRSTSSTVTNPQPIVDFTPGKVTGELVLGTNSFAPSGSTSLRRVTITGAAGPGAVLSAGTNIAVSAYTIPPNARQPGVTATLDSIDGRFQSTVYQIGNNVWAVHAVSVGGFANLRWYKIDAATGNVLLSGTLSDGSFDLTQPSIAANANDQVVIGCTRSGSTAGSGLPGTYAFVGTPGAGTINFTGSIQLKTGASAYGISGVQRWGDYSATSVDPSDPSIFWTTQEWCKASNAWSTQISEIINPMPNEFRWANAASGNFALGSAWLTGSSPTTSNHAIFSRATTAGPYVVTINSSQVNDRLSVRQGQVDFLNSATYTLGNTSLATPSFILGEFEATPTLRLRGSGTLATVNSFIAPNSVSAGSLTMLDTSVWTNSAGLYVGGNSTAAGGPANVTLSSGGSTPTLRVGGTLKVWNNASINYNAGTLAAAALDVTGGQVLLSTGKNKTLVVGSAASSGSVSVSGGGKVDLADNFMIVDYSGATVQPAVFALIKNGYNSGAWTGVNSITSSSAAAAAGSAHVTAIGYAERSELGVATFGNNAVDNTSVLARYTLAGDANLDATVDLTDFTFLAANFNKIGGATWLNGDFNYDNNVDLTDFTFLASNFNQTLPAEFSGTVIPEPATLSLLACGFASVITRRRRRR